MNYTVTAHEVGHKPRYEMNKQSLFSAFGSATPIDTVHYGLMLVGKIERHEKSSNCYYVAGRGLLGEKIFLTIHSK